MKTRANKQELELEIRDIKAWCGHMAHEHAKAVAHGKTEEAKKLMKQFIELEKDLRFAINSYCVLTHQDSGLIAVQYFPRGWYYDIKLILKHPIKMGKGVLV